MVVISRIAKINKEGKHEHISTQFFSKSGKWVSRFKDAKKFNIDDAFKKVDGLSKQYVYSFIKHVDFDIYEKKFNKEDEKETDKDESNLFEE